MISLKVELRPWQKGDEEALARNANNGKIWACVRDYFPHPYTLTQAYEWINYAQSQVGNYAIVVANEVVGGIAVVPQEDILRKNLEIGYWLGEAYWGNGIATLAVKQMVARTFEEREDIHRIFAGVFSFNKGSQRVLEKAGFRQEAVLKEAVFKNGQFWDDHLYALLRSEFLAQNGERKEK